MIEKFMALFERLVIAVEILAGLEGIVIPSPDDDEDDPADEDWTFKYIP